MLKDCKTGKAISEEDIPPAVLVGSSRSNSSRDVSQSTIPQKNIFPDSLPQNTVMPLKTPYSYFLYNLYIFQASVAPQAFPKMPSPTNDPFSTPMPSIWASELPSIPAAPIQEPCASDIIPKLSDLQTQYKMAALNSKKSGNSEHAIAFMKVYKQLGSITKAVEEGKTVDMNSLPPAPSDYFKSKTFVLINGIIILMIEYSISFES